MRINQMKTKEIDKKTKVFSAKKPSRVQITPERCKTLCERAGIEYLEGYENRVIEHVITDETVDRAGDIVRAKGVDWKNYLKNPVILFAHDSYNFPVGNSIRIKYEDESVKSWGLYFDERIDSSGRSDLVFRFVASGAMSGCSVGFIPMEIYDPSDPKERKRLGLGEYGIEIKKSELLEYSICSIPCNPNALQNSITSKDMQLIKQEKMLSEEIYKELEQLLIDGIKKNNIQFDIPEEEKEFDPIEKPYPNEHSCRLKDPVKYETCRRSKRTSDGKQYSVITCKLKDDDKWEEQAFRYPKDTWTISEARAHCKNHNGILFEPAGKAAEILENSLGMSIEKAVSQLIIELQNLGKEVKNLKFEFQEAKQPISKEQNHSQQTGDLPKNKKKGLYNEDLNKIFDDINI